MWYNKGARKILIFYWGESSPLFVLLTIIEPHFGKSVSLLISMMVISILSRKQGLTIFVSWVFGSRDFYLGEFIMAKQFGKKNVKVTNIDKKQELTNFEIIEFLQYE